MTNDSNSSAYDDNHKLVAVRSSGTTFGTVSSLRLDVHYVYEREGSLRKQFRTQSCSLVKNDLFVALWIFEARVGFFPSSATSWAPCVDLLEKKKMYKHCFRPVLYIFYLIFFFMCPFSRLRMWTFVSTASSRNRLFPVSRVVCCDHHFLILGLILLAYIAAARKLYLSAILRAQWPDDEPTSRAFVYTLVFSRSRSTTFGSRVWFCYINGLLIKPNWLETPFLFIIFF